MNLIYTFEDDLESIFERLEYVLSGIEEEDVESLMSFEYFGDGYGNGLGIFEKIDGK